MRSRVVLLACAVAATLAFGDTPSAQATRQMPPLALESLTGEDSFERYCASCHGPGGKGDGRVASALRTPPPDLTQLAIRNDGTYPGDRVRALVAGRGNQPAAHGTTDMPVWGPIFHALDPSDVRVAQRIENIVRYVEGMQEPSSGPSSLGATLFATHCASCHGRNAKGAGIVTSELRNSPPDLTRFTTRNGGVFPRERIYQIIDGRHVKAHGDRDMPIWGDAFSRTRGLSEAAVKTRIDALVRHLEAIQERPAE
jgi:mono/diheme cytochrome c family protein